MAKPATTLSLETTWDDVRKSLPIKKRVFLVVRRCYVLVIISLMVMGLTGMFFHSSPPINPVVTNGKKIKTKLSKRRSELCQYLDTLNRQANAKVNSKVTRNCY